MKNTTRQQNYLLFILSFIIRHGLIVSAVGTALGLASSPLAGAQIAPDAKPTGKSALSAKAIMNDADKSGNDLAVLRGLQTRQAELTDTPDKAWMYWQMLAVCLSRAGDYNGALEATGKVKQQSFGLAPKPAGAPDKKQESAQQENSRQTKNKPDDTKQENPKPDNKPRGIEDEAQNRLVGYTPRNALAAIAEAARTRRVVMINEAHHVPQHRVFTTRLLAALYKQGYRWFAAETLSERDINLNRRGYPTRQTGYYTSEPTYGELVRAALRLGYHVVPYEAEGKGEMRPGMTQADLTRAVEERERGQAENLIRRVFKADPHARLLVHVGYGHAAKNKRSTAGYQLMGWHFKRLSGLDALTIDQTTMSEADAPERENALYRHVADDLTDAIVYARGNASHPFHDYFAEGSAGVRDDMQVFHPRYHSAQGRPDWLENGTGRVVISVPAPARQAADRAGKVLIRAYIPRELKAHTWRAIPFDQIVVEKDRPVRALMLLPGKYRLQAWTAAGEIVYDAPLLAAGVPHDISQENLTLRAELRRMIEVDQDIRLRLIASASSNGAHPDKALADEGKRVDTANTSRMRQIVAQYGWPNRRLVGREGAYNAFILVQHADLAPDFQRQCLPLLQTAAEQGDVELPDLAYLTDRVLAAQGKPQRYGSQMMRMPQGELIMRPTEDVAHLDARRRAMNLPPIKEYLQMVKAMYALKPSPAKPQP